MTAPATMRMALKDLLTAGHGTAPSGNTRDAPNTEPGQESRLPPGSGSEAITVTTIDKAVLTKRLLTVSQACRHYPGSRGNPSVVPSTMTRWILKGCPARSGERIKLRATRCGSRWLIDPADLAAFFEALAGTTNSTVAPTGRRTDARRSAASERAARELEKRGA